MSRAVYSKEQARKIVRSKLESVSSEVYLEGSRSAYSSAVNLLSEHANVQQVLLYSPYAKWREVDLSGLERVFRNIQFSYAPNGSGAPFPSVSFDVVFVPLYGFTKEGYRLGHGGGWYDRLLARQRSALKVGIGLEAGLVEFIPEPHDVPLDIIITERQVLIYEGRTRS